MSPPVPLLREKPPSVPCSRRGSALEFSLCCYLEELGSPFPGASDPQYSHTQLTAWRTHSSHTASHWCLYRSSFLVPLVLVPVPLYARIFLPPSRSGT